ncbi:hypothetical protein B0H13DRAFT_2681382 [Mycena leptocephala]|nr:hypothetical protein B0H13DRAFT_2681382 [Mycena leptocephala]
MLCATDRFTSIDGCALRGPGHPPHPQHPISPAALPALPRHSVLPSRDPHPAAAAPCAHPAPLHPPGGMSEPFAGHLASSGPGPMVGPPPPMHALCTLQPTAPSVFHGRVDAVLHMCGDWNPFRGSRSCTSEVATCFGGSCHAPMPVLISCFPSFSIM